MDIIASLMVLPNRMCVPLIDQVKVDQMRFPLPRVCKTRLPSQTLQRPSTLFTTDYWKQARQKIQFPYWFILVPSNEINILRDFSRKTRLQMLWLLLLSAVQGVVRVHLLEGRDLVAKDTYMMGLVKGKSDPYATLRVGNRQFKSKTIKENLHPQWNEVYEVERSRSIPLPSLRSFLQICSLIIIIEKSNTFMSCFLYLCVVCCAWSSWPRVGVGAIWWRHRQRRLYGKVRNYEIPSWLMQLGSLFQKFSLLTAKVWLVKFLFELHPHTHADIKKSCFP